MLALLEKLTVLDVFFKKKTKNNNLRAGHHRRLQWSRNEQVRKKSKRGRQNSSRIKSSHSPARIRINENYIRGLTVFYKAKCARHVTLFFWIKLSLVLSFYTTEIVVNSLWVLIGTPSLFISVMQGWNLWPHMLSRDVGFILVTPEKPMILWSPKVLLLFPTQLLGHRNLNFQCQIAYLEKTYFQNEREIKTF